LVRKVIAKLTLEDIKMTPQTLTIHLFANLKEKAGSGELRFEVAQPFTAGDLKARLKKDYPALSTQLNKVVVTVNNGQIFLNEEVIPPGAEVTLLPPFGGG